jgi:phospholipase C
MIRVRLQVIAAVLTAAMLAACSSGGEQTAIPNGSVPNQSIPGASLQLGKYIKHVFIIVQENRSFDNIFTGYAGSNYSLYGCAAAGSLKPETAAATTSTITCPSGDTQVKLQPITFRPATPQDIAHSWADALHDVNGGNMDQFGDAELGQIHHVGAFAYSYLEHSVVTSYWAMANRYVLADHMFATENGPSFTAHVDLIAGTTDLSTKEALVNLPSSSGAWGCDSWAGTYTRVVALDPQLTMGIGPFPCFKQFRTMADTLDAAKVPWKYYAPTVNGKVEGGIWSTFDAIYNVRYGHDWAANVQSATPETKVLSDAASDKLPSVAWVVPDYQNSDHEGNNSDTGPSWVAAVVNAIGHSKDWSSSAIIVVWDDWGGWYDNVQPPKLDYIGLGLRVPCIIISPYAKTHYVLHTQLEFGSILKFVETAFNLQTLGAKGIGYGYTDTRAANILDAFDFTQKPRAFVTIPAKYPTSHFTRERPSFIVPDDD